MMAGSLQGSLWLILLAGVGDPEPAPALMPQRDRLEADVRLLAGREYSGRSGAGARLAGDRLIERFRGLGLRPGFGDQYSQEFEAGPSQGRNIAGLLPGSDPERSGEWLIVSAHYDHLGVRGGRLYPGADDNASGVAMVLEVARCLAEAPEPPERSILFVLFDREEQGLLGSRAFVQDPPVPLETIRLFITADMLGRSLLGLQPKTLFVMGTEHASGLRSLLDDVPASPPIRVATIGADVLFIDRSDYGPFRVRKIPFLFFTTGQSRVYHTPDDLPETIDYEGLHAATALILRVVARAASVDVLPKWSDQRVPWVEEAETVRDVFRNLLEHRDEVPLSDAQRTSVEGLIDRIDGWVESGSLTPNQRSSMIRTAQWILFSIL